MQYELGTPVAKINGLEFTPSSISWQLKDQNLISNLEYNGAKVSIMPNELKRLVGDVHGNYIKYTDDLPIKEAHFSLQSAISLLIERMNGKPLVIRFGNKVRVVEDVKVHLDQVAINESWSMSSVQPVTFIFEGKVKFLPVLSPEEREEKLKNVLIQICHVPFLLAEGKEEDFSAAGHAWSLQVADQALAELYPEDWHLRSSLLKKIDDIAKQLGINLR